MVKRCAGWIISKNTKKATVRQVISTVSFHAAAFLLDLRHVQIRGKEMNSAASFGIRVRSRQIDCSLSSFTSRAPRRMANRLKIADIAEMITDNNIAVPLLAAPV